MVMRRREFLTLAGLAASSVLAGGCSAGGGAPGGSLRAAFGQPVTDLDPYNAGTAVDEASLIVKRLVFDTLVRREGDRLVPGLAARWRRQGDTTWVFDLREGVRFHDGTPLTARDVVACLKRTQEVKSAQSSLWVPVKAARADGDHTVVFETDGPLATLPVNLTLLFIVPGRLVADPEQKRRPVGSGPFRVTGFTPSTSVELARFDGYWSGPPALPGISMPFIAETSSAITALRNGDIDLLWPVPPDQLPEARGDGVDVRTVPSWTYYLTWFHCGRAPFTDPRVRRAMWQALDLEEIVGRLFGAGAERMRAPIPAGVFGFAEQRPYAHDPAAARRALRDAGLGGGFTTSMMWFDATGPLARELAQTMISSWAEIGVTVRPQSIEKAQWLQRLNSLDWTMELQTNTVTTGDAAFTLGRLYTSKANRMGYKNAELDAILAAAGRETGEARRRELYGRACAIIWDDAVGVFPAALTTAYGLRSELSGFTPAADNQPDLSAVRRG
ncbi:ABC transporter substrate-binding protein [Actinomadura viridis]|uniref:Peptide/nickel transport system substrate-binding protein n=1 Tax=Actinomadura viridis TaxID=58110 RepID=A0A931DLK7_9ACTN|nr:ABC transporter substrate-binding protein [Actinomadura viridis]MBG6089295.1 peptide/nickel transport system substrate-binding protein [Actinomadura viridis]